MSSNKTNPMMSKILALLGVTKEELTKGNDYQSVLHKMGMVGMTETLKVFADAIKTTIMGTPGIINAAVVRIYLNSIISSAAMLEQMLADYEARVSTKPSTQTTSPTNPISAAEPDHFPDDDYQDEYEKSDAEFLESLLKGFPKRTPGGGSGSGNVN